MSEKLNPQSTKKEILDAYHKLKEKVEKQRSEDIQLQKKRSEEKEVVHNATIPESADLENNIEELKKNIISFFVNMEGNMDSQRKKLDQVQEAIKIESKNMEEIYQIKVEADSLAALILAHKEKESELDEEIQQEKDTWEKEQETHQALLQEEDENLKKKRKREEDEYKYQTDLKRKQESDAYLSKKTALEQELQKKKEQFEKEWTEREKNISVRELEMKEMKEKLENFPKEMEKSVRDAEKRVSDQLIQKYTHEAELYKKQMEAEVRLKDHIVASLQEKITEKDAQIRELSAKTDTAGLQVKEIAVKALEGASLQRAYQSLTANADKGNSPKN